MVVTLGQQYNIVEKPTVILYTYINRHAGTPEKFRIFSVLAAKSKKLLGTMANNPARGLVSRGKENK